MSAIVDPRLLGAFDEPQRRWRVAAGSYRLAAGFDAADRQATAPFVIGAFDLPP